MYNFFSDPVNAQLVNNCRNEFKPILKVDPAVISDVYILTSCFIPTCAPAGAWLRYTRQTDANLRYLPFHPTEWPISNFSLKFQYYVKNTDDENKAS